MKLRRITKRNHRLHSRVADVSFNNRKEAESIISYLLNPTKNGLWILSFKMLSNAGITKYLKENQKKIMRE